MKKIFALFVVAASFAACNNEGSADASIKDSALEKIDSAGDARVDSIQEATDSLTKTVESTFEKTDSANRAIVDSTNKQ